MLMNLLYGLPVMVACLLLQSLLVSTALQYYARREPLVKQALFCRTMSVISGVMLILVVGNVAQVVI